MKPMLITVFCSTLFAAGCGPRGSGLDLTIELDGAPVPWMLTVEVVQLDASGEQRASSATYSGASFFSDIGSTNRVLVIPRSSTVSLNVTASAEDIGGGTVAMRSASFMLTPGVLTMGTLSLGGSSTDAAVDGGDAGGCGLCTGGRICADGGCECPASDPIECVAGCAPTGAACSTLGLCPNDAECMVCPVAPNATGWCCNDSYLCCSDLNGGPQGCTNGSCYPSTAECMTVGGLPCSAIANWPCP